MFVRRNIFSDCYRVLEINKVIMILVILNVIDGLMKGVLYRLGVIFIMVGLVVLERMS